MIKHVFVGAALALALAGGAQAQIYKCVENGKTVFIDKPCTPDAQPLVVRPAAGAYDPYAADDARRAHEARTEQLRAGSEARAERAGIDAREREERRRHCNSIQAEIDRHAERAKYNGAHFLDVAGRDAAQKRFDRECR